MRHHSDEKSSDDDIGDIGVSAVSVENANLIELKQANRLLRQEIERMETLIAVNNESVVCDDDLGEIDAFIMLQYPEDFGIIWDNIKRTMTVRRFIRMWSVICSQNISDEQKKRIIQVFRN